MYSPTSSNLQKQTTVNSMEADESVGLPESVGLLESVGLPSLKLGTDLVRLNNLVTAVNENLKDCGWCKVSRLDLVSDCCV